MRKKEWGHTACSAGCGAGRPGCAPRIAHLLPEKQGGVPQRPCASVSSCAQRRPKGTVSCATCALLEAASRALGDETQSRCVLGPGFLARSSWKHPNALSQRSIFCVSSFIFQAFCKSHPGSGETGDLGWGPQILPGRGWSSGRPSDSRSPPRALGRREGSWRRSIRKVLERRHSGASEHPQVAAGWHSRRAA